MEPEAKLPACSLSFPVKRAGPKYAVARSETISADQHILRVVSGNGTRDTPFTGLTKCLGSGRAARSALRTPPKPDIDAHLLLVLADQELTEGREEQARYLVEAAYEALDRKAEAEVHILRRCD
jgi:hypothetical protein